MAGVWLQIKGKAKEQWGMLTADDLKQLEGYAEQLAGEPMLFGLSGEPRHR